ncbi:MAG: ribosome recycling factor [Kordiimonadaceae bacterium]|nr:ribosome recycling factor [Kordiimonadaceae bacterium]
MSDDEIDLDDIERRMSGAVDSLKHEFSGLRTGRASTSLLDSITVDVYGAVMPLNQIGTVSVPEARMLTVQVWDKSNSQAVEKAIRTSGLGLNPMLDGQLVRIPIPELNEERRRELTRIAAKYSEASRISVRNVRKAGMDQLKKMEKDKSIGEDDHKMYADEVQSLTDKFVAQIDTALDTKDKEIMQV